MSGCCGLKSRVHTHFPGHAEQQRPREQKLRIVQASAKNFIEKRTSLQNATKHWSRGNNMYMSVDSAYTTGIDNHSSHQHNSSGSASQLTKNKCAGHAHKQFMHHVESSTTSTQCFFFFCVELGCSTQEAKLHVHARSHTKRHTPVQTH